MTQRVTRRKSFTGQQVTVTTRDGWTATGTLLGWGSQLFRMRTAEGTWTELATCNLDTVVQA
jgi:hypothetical protein